MTMVAPRLKDPPIIEVVCGFFFPAVPGLDPILVGKYWAERKEAHGFPSRQLHPPVADRPGFFLGEGVGPLRAWLVSAPDEYVLQIQPDPFYFNWRKHESAYPHFGDHEPTKGVLSRSLLELAELGDFTLGALGQKPKPTQLELAKIDLLVSPKHWSDDADLTKVLPALGTLPRITGEPTVNLSVVGERAGFQLHFAIASVVLASDMSRAIQIETRVTAREPGSDMRKTFEAMNAVANQVFFETVSDKELNRFGGEVS
ncbi:MAG: hypothetical protein ABSC94_32415 [Polyangiaceae bacterium]|jgi:uncharacterized protein (TIGR04255 family)